MPKKNKNKSGLPYQLEDKTGSITYPIFAIERTFNAVRVVYHRRFPDHLVTDHTILDEYIVPPREEAMHGAGIYYPVLTNGEPLFQTHVDNVRRSALEHGATPEAVRLLGLLEPWTKKEEAILAEKLKNKAAKVKEAEAAEGGAKKGRKAKGEKPVGGGGKLGGKKGGNPEALAKAREAAAANRSAIAESKLKINVTKKQLGDEIKLRGGRLEKLTWIIENKPKTVGDALGQEFTGSDGEEYTIDMGAIRGMEKRGHVSIES
jgi:hypothetical protein